MLIGPHVGKLPAPREHRDFAELYGWGCFQVNFGSSKSFDVPIEFQRSPGFEVAATPLWFQHAAYIAAAAPKPDKWEAHGHYLKAITRSAAWWKIAGIVVHIGASVGLDAKAVVATVHRFVEAVGLDKWLLQSNTKLIVEIPASISGFSCNPQFFAESIRDKSYLGYCLDLAHVYGTGVKWDRLRTVIRNDPPTICHANFPGTYFASSCDVHGWRTRPELYKDGRKMARRSQGEIDELTSEWDDVIRLLKSLNVPLIVEGSSFEGDPKLELEFIKEL